MSKDSSFNSCDCDMFTRPSRLRNVFTRCSDVVTNSVLLTYAEVDKERVRITHGKFYFLFSITYRNKKVTIIWLSLRNTRKEFGKN